MPRCGTNSNRLAVHYRLPDWQWFSTPERHRPKRQPGWRAQAKALSPGLMGVAHGQVQTDGLVGRGVQVEVDHGSAGDGDRFRAGVAASDEEGRLFVLIGHRLQLRSQRAVGDRRRLIGGQSDRADVDSILARRSGPSGWPARPPRRPSRPAAERCLTYLLPRTHTYWSVGHRCFAPWVSALSMRPSPRSLRLPCPEGFLFIPAALPLRC